MQVVRATRSGGQDVRAPLKPPATAGRHEDQEIFGLAMKEQVPNHRIAICVDNTDYEMSLERRKVYPILPDADAERRSLHAHHR